MRVLEKNSDIDELSRDAGIYVIRPAEAWVAESDGDVSAVLERARAKGLAITPRGGGTSIPSQSVGRGIILLQNRNEIVVGEGKAECGPSVVKAVLNKELEAHGVWLPADPSSYETCTVGGMVSNNSSGTRTFKYGSTIDYVTKLDVVLPEEGSRKVAPLPVEDALHADHTTRKVAELILANLKDIESEKPKVTKNSSGYRLEHVVHDGLFDLPKLFVGSEGTLGIVTHIEFDTPPRPNHRALLIVETSLREMDRVTALFRALEPAAVELVDKSVFKQTGRAERLKALSRTEEQYLVYCELDGKTGAELEGALERALASPISGLEPLTITDGGAMVEAWGARNEILTLAADLRIGKRTVLPGVEDLVVPPERLGDLVSILLDEFEGRGLSYISYGHAGDANLHMRPFLDRESKSEMGILEEIMESCFEKVWGMKGSITGEHGDGMLRAEHVRRQYPKTHELMKQIRSLYDPKGLLSPGVKIV